MERPINDVAVLSPEQYAVVKSKAQPLLILAGAGSGKTRTLVYRIAKFIEDGIPAKTILLLTFTNRAAKDMLNRLQKICGDEGCQVQGGTFHHVALQYLRRYAAALNYTIHFTLLDRFDAKELMEFVLAENSEILSHKKLPKADVLLEVISLSMNTLTPIHEIIFTKFSRFYTCTTEIAQIALAFMEKKLAMNVMDFDDLLINFRLLLTEHSFISDSIQKEIQAVMVDEYQDTNRLQGEIIDALVLSHRNLTVVGDDAQNIYGFRGADIENMLKFSKRYPDALLMSLKTNYRSTSSILSVANASLFYAQVGFKKKLVPVRLNGEFPALVSCQNAMQQANFIAQRISELKKNGVKLNEIAVLYRAHRHAIEIQAELLNRHISFKLCSGIKFFEQAHVKDVMSYLRFIYNPDEALSFKRAIKLYTGVGRITADKTWTLYQSAQKKFGDDMLSSIQFLLHDSIRDLSKSAVVPFLELLGILISMIKTNSVSELIKFVLKTGYEDYLLKNFSNAKDRIDDILQLAEYALSYSSFETFLNESLLMKNLEENGKERDLEKVSLSSIHQAKGLEWNHVFVVWLCEGRFPSEFSLREREGIEEERRLFYVAVTRAKDFLFLCYPRTGLQNDGRIKKLMKSRFIEELLLTSGTAVQFENWILEEENDIIANV
jgi:DNA helicase II / ATP-dependent DNA helicase PcrA